MNNLWEKFYQEKGEQGMMQFPFSIIIELIRFYENKNNINDKSKINILEIGAGSGVNLKYAASLGYNVYGIDISETATNYAKKSFKKNNLNGNFLTASADSLPFEDDFFHIIIDHGALVCVDENTYKKAIDEIYRVGKKNSITLLTPQSEISSYATKLFKDNHNETNMTFKNSEIYLNNIGLNMVINILNNRFSVEVLRRNDRTDYTLSNDKKYIINEKMQSIYYMFIQKQ